MYEKLNICLKGILKIYVIGLVSKLIIFDKKVLILGLKMNILYIEI